MWDDAAFLPLIPSRWPPRHAPEEHPGGEEDGRNEGVGQAAAQSAFVHRQRRVDKPNRCADVPDPVEVPLHFPVGCSAARRRSVPSIVCRFVETLGHPAHFTALPSSCPPVLSSLFPRVLGPIGSETRPLTCYAGRGPRSHPSGTQSLRAGSHLGTPSTPSTTPSRNPCVHHHGRARRLRVLLACFPFQAAIMRLLAEPPILPMTRSRYEELSRK